MTTDGTGDTEEPKLRPPTPHGVTFIDVDALDRIAPLGPSAIAVYVALESYYQEAHHDDDDPPPLAGIARRAGVSVSTARRVLRALRDHGILCAELVGAASIRLRPLIDLAAHAARHRLG